MSAVISTIIVNYNAGKLLRGCVDSVLNCPLEIEIIVVDNASTDGSLDALAGLPNVQIIKNTTNVGFAAACNIGVQPATGKYFFFLNPDCILAVDAVQRMLETAGSAEDVGMVGGLLVDPDGTEQGGGRRAIPTPWRSFVRAFGLARFSDRWPRLFFDFHLHKQPLPDHAIEVEAISGACMMVRREAMEDVGEWDEGYFLHCEDLDWCMRFRQQGWKILFVPSAQITHALGVCGRNRPVFVEWHKHKGMMRFYRKFFRLQYPGGMMALVAAGVWLRFGLVATYYTGKHIGKALDLGVAANAISLTPTPLMEPLAFRPDRQKTPVKPVLSVVEGSPVIPKGDRLQPNHVGVIGATSLVGECLLPLLTEAGWRVTAFSRGTTDHSVDEVEWRKLSLSPSVHLPQGETSVIHWICIAPIWVLSEHFALLEAHGAQRVVVLSSTSRFTKKDSSDPEEQVVARRLINAEVRVQAWAESLGAKCVILRPTLIYGRGWDKNISEIARIIRRFGFFPLLGKASGLRQPIHAADVAAACLAALQVPCAANRAYNISGGGTLTYRDMVTRVFSALGRRPRLLTVPLWAFRLAVSVLRRLPRYRQWSAAMAERMNRDLVFDHAEAARDLGFKPRAFMLETGDLPTEIPSKLRMPMVK